MTRLILAVLTLLLAGSLHAQDLPSKPQPQTMVRVQLTYPSEENAKHEVILPVPHRTADKAWMAWNSAAIALTATDMGLALTHPQFEAEPVTRKVPIIATSITSAGTILAVWWSYREKREEDAVLASGYRHRGVRWWVADAFPVVTHGVSIAISLATLAHK